MPITLEGSCRCGAVRFSVASHTPYPYQLCYCSICRKTAGGGGFAINIMGDARTLAVIGRRPLRIYHAEIGDDGNCETSSGERHFCSKCASALWLFSPEWPELVHPFAWVEPAIGPHDLVFEEYPEQSIEQWHRDHKLWVK
jgi:hypothetical protein